MFVWTGCLCTERERERERAREAYQVDDVRDHLIWRNVTVLLEELSSFCRDFGHVLRVPRFTLRVCGWRFVFGR